MGSSNLHVFLYDLSDVRASKNREACALGDVARNMLVRVVPLDQEMFS